MWRTCLALEQNCLKYWRTTDGFVFGFIGDSDAMLNRVRGPCRFLHAERRNEWLRFSGVLQPGICQPAKISVDGQASQF